MNLLLIAPDELDADGTAHLSGARATHIHAVLKPAIGQQLRVGLIDGPFGSGRVLATSPTVAQLACTFEPDTPARPPVDLLLAVPRPKVLRRLWAQLAALGVGRIILTNAARVERNYFDTHMLAPDTYRPLLLEGLQQARDTRVPDVSVHRQFRILVEDHLDAIGGPSTRLVADPMASTRISAALPGGADAHQRVLLAVGPEGGWNTFELGLLTAHGFRTVDMGPRTLRSDTACIALLALVHDSLRSAAG